MKARIGSCLRLLAVQSAALERRQTAPGRFQIVFQRLQVEAALGLWNYLPKFRLSGGRGR